MAIYKSIIRRNNMILTKLTHKNTTLSQYHHKIRLSTTKQLKLSNNIREELKSKFSNISLKSPTTNFKILCVLTCVTITGSSLIFLRENLLFGTIGGVTAKTLTAPLDRLAVFRQASIDFKSSLRLVINGIFKEEGIKGFWRGNGINVFRASIQKGSLFALQDFFRTLLTNDEKEKLQNSLGLSFISGWLAGLASTIITFPLDTIKTVNQATIHQKQWHAIQIWYSLAMKKGYLRGPWTCVLPTAIGASFYYAIKFMVFDACVMSIGIVNNKYNFQIQNDIKNAIGGLCAGVIGNAITYPNNCVRKRMQTSHVCDAIGVKYVYEKQNYINTAKQFYINEGGIKRFYKGFGINVLRNAPNTAIQFVVYKRLQSLWNDNHNKD
eukprot:324403_1